MFKKMWTQANFSEGGGGGGGAEDDDVRGKRNAAVVARQKFEAEPQTKVGAKKVRILFRSHRLVPGRLPFVSPPPHVRPLFSCRLAFDL